MKRVLLIAYYFPPLGGGGVQRPLQWARHLPPQGWLPTVLTVETGYWSSRDESGLARIPSDVEVVRTPFISAVTLRERARKLLPGRHDTWQARAQPAGEQAAPTLRSRMVEAVKPLWQTPDEFFGWYPFAVREAKKLLEARRFDAVITTAPPFTCHWIGRRLRKDGGPPWVCDFRDAWTRMPEYPHTNPVQLAIERRMERAVLKCADRILTTTEPTAADFAEIYPPIGARTHVLPNGYDPDLFDFSKPSPYTKGDKLRFVFSGTQLLGQSIERFLAALGGWVIKHPDASPQVELVYAGPEGDRVKQAAERTGTSELVSSLGYLPHREVVQLQQSADVLLYLGYSPEACSSVVPGKLYEYLAARRPLLALTHPGPSAQRIERARAGWVVDPESEEMLHRTLDEIRQRWREGTLTCEGDLGWIERHFSRKRQSEQLAAILNELSPL